MASKAISQNKFLDPEFATNSGRDANGTTYKKANVYDAVAGKISSNGFIPKQRVYASTRDTASSSITAIPPENVLFKRKDAPVRYAESDSYFGNQRQSTIGLPDTDLLKTVHSYTSDFYARAIPYGRKNWMSLDETALLAFGILMEEASREILGLTGDLVITEGAEVDEKISTSLQSSGSSSSGRHYKKRRTQN